jgi:hypothetical protein
MNAILKALTIFLMASFFVQAEVPKQISYQGVLTDPSGAWVADGVYSIKFRIYDDSIGGNILWETSGYVPLQIHHGMIKHDLGSTNSLPDSIAAYPNQWVGMTVNLGSELTPRTKLLSVPFSFLARHSDTSEVSRDKTINAGELTLGTLDTARYSAYNDLASENKIGNGANQVAAGNHTHAGYSGAIMRFEDTSAVVVNYNAPDWQLVRQVNLPSGIIGRYFKSSFTLVNNGSYWGNSSYIDLRINSISVYNWRIDNSPLGLTGLATITAFNNGLNKWILELRGSTVGIVYRNLEVDLSQGVNIEIYFKNDGYVGGNNISFGYITVEYDVD